jgi:hypothetical protein
MIRYEAELDLPDEPVHAENLLADGDWLIFYNGKDQENPVRKVPYDDVRRVERD